MEWRICCRKPSKAFPRRVGDCYLIDSYKRIFHEGYRPESLHVFWQERAPGGGWLADFRIRRIGVAHER